MRITKEHLLKHVEQFSFSRAKEDATINSIYLTGSILRDDPFIKGTADIDLVMVHAGEIQQMREIFSFSAEISFDINHYPVTFFSDPRKLRANPWVGCSLCNDPLLIYGRGHWFEYILASTEANFFEAQNISARARIFSNEARKSWFSFKNQNEPNLYKYLQKYYYIIENASNAVACFTGSPLSLRRMMIEIKQCADQIGQPQISAAIYRLLIGEKDPHPYKDYFVQPWKYYLNFFSQNYSTAFKQNYHPARFEYITQAVEHFWGNHTVSAMYILGKTWADINTILKIEHCEYFENFMIITETHPHYKTIQMEKMDTLLDHIETILDNYEKENGIHSQSATFI